MAATASQILPIAIPEKDSPAVDLPSPTFPEEEFEKAAAHLKILYESLGPKELRKIYALYKQATLGTEGFKNVSAPRAFQFMAAEKYKSWKAIADQNMPKEEAMKQYVDFVDELIDKYGLME